MTTIPGPPGLPLVGNLADLDHSDTSKSFYRLAEQYGDIYRINILGRSVVVLNTRALIHEVHDETRFYKKPQGALLEVRNGVYDGLFTAFESEPNWGIAHRILMPSFGPFAIKGMFDEMHEIGSQMVSRWAREGPDKVIDPTEDFTRLALDSIALCSMDTRFNSFYRNELHPFVSAMGFFLLESGRRSQRPKFMTDYVYRATKRQYYESIELMKATARQAIDNRRQNTSNKKDLLNAMLEGVDAKTKKKMSDDNIINNAITFLIAGHETTSGTLSFTTFQLLKNPSSLARAQKEVDDVVGTGPVTIEHVSKMPFISACLRETLRVNSPITLYAVTPREDQGDELFLGPEKYIVKQGDSIIANLKRAHFDPEVYGEDAGEYKPERMLEENFNKLPPHSWNPFGNGTRACIGRAFAWQEMHLVLALILQNFNLRLHDPSYVLETMETLTIKPKGLKIHATLRHGLDPIALERRVWGGKEAPKANEQAENIATVSSKEKKPMTILYGTNTGTCEALAQNLAKGASNRGYEPEVKSMDSGAGSLPKHQPVAIITASYEGEPPDNAAHFIEWLRSLKVDELKEVNYAVFGCGNHDWVSTYQKIPKLTDEIVSEHSGSRICERGFTDVAENHIFDDFDAWTDKFFWPGVMKVFGGEQRDVAQSLGLDIDLEPGSRASDLRHDVHDALVKENRLLTAPGEPEKKHIEIELPTGTNYSTGDYLAVLPVNPESLVKYVMARFRIRWDARVTIKPGQHTFLPIGQPLPIYDLLSAYVELSLTATQKNISILAQYFENPEQQKALECIPQSEIVGKHMSILDLLERFPNCALPFGDYLAMLSPLRVRQYSISSSPLTHPYSCTLTYGVLNVPSASRPEDKRYLGTASNYLATVRSGDRILVAVRPSKQNFHLPLDVEKVPIIMCCAGTGLSPFHGFVEERAAQVAAGRNLAPAMLFVGCRHPERDILYKEEFEELAKNGVVDVRYAFSKAPEQSEGCKYVQDRLWKDRGDVNELWKMGGRIYTCGKGKVGEAIKDTIVRAAMELGQKEGRDVTKEKTEAWFESIREERFASDIFA